ncbi:MAG: DUF47 family protein [Kiloniellales bacterium]|nr:DUF47 family protein [Kiloniellales bacterium]
MVNVLPFQRTSLLISGIDDYLDRVADSMLVLEQTLMHYVDQGADEHLEQRLKQIREIESRADELRREIANVMYTQMLMPDTRGDILTLLDEIDNVLDDCVRLVVGLAIERPEVPKDVNDDTKIIVANVVKSVEAMVEGARTYFKDPRAVRNHTQKIGFYEEEATTLSLQLGVRVFDSDLPLERKRQLGDWIVSFRQIASKANDVGDRMAIFAVKRSL